MKLVILAGGYGSRLGNMTDNIPKPMIQIGGKPILWHIMKIYSYYGINEFIICLGYKGEVIKDYFLHYYEKTTDFTIDLKEKKISFDDADEVNWKVTLVDTGINTLKGGRLKKIEKYLDSDINLLTYGDGLANINIHDLIEFHKKSKKTITISGVNPPARFGELVFEGEVLKSFEEKAQTSQGMINGGFMVFNKDFLKRLTVDEACDLETTVIKDMVLENEVAIYKHKGLWACMDTERDYKYLETLWSCNKAFWKVW